MERVVLEYSGLLESCSPVVELFYCMFFERYGLDVMVPVVLWYLVGAFVLYVFERYGLDVMVPGTEYGTVTSVLDEYTYSRLSVENG